MPRLRTRISRSFGLLFSFTNMCSFFFQAEDGIRDRNVTGVQTCALPIYPRPAPRFDGKVLHRPERSGGRSLLWVVWALIAVALIVLIVLMVTGVLGQDSAAAAFPSLDLAAPDLPDLLSDRPVLKEAATRSEERRV